MTFITKFETESDRFLVSFRSKVLCGWVEDEWKCHRVIWWPWKCITQILCWEENSWPWVLAADPLAPHLSSNLSISSKQPMAEHDDGTSSGPLFWDVQFLKWETLHWRFQIGLAKTFIKLYFMIQLLPHAPFFYLSFTCFRLVCPCLLLPCL